MTAPKERHAGTQGYAEAMLLYYNKRLKYPLRWNHLRQGGTEEAADGVQGVAGEGQFSMEDGVSLHAGAGEEAEDTDSSDEDDDTGVPDSPDALQPDMLFDNFGAKMLI